MFFNSSCLHCPIPLLLSYIITVQVYAFLCVHLVYAQVGLQDMKTLNIPMRDEWHIVTYYRYTRLFSYSTHKINVGLAPIKVILHINFV